MIVKQASSGWLEANRKKIGITLMLLGVIPWLALMLYIVQVRIPSGPVIAATVACWAIFFLGKTLTKSRMQH